MIKYLVDIAVFIVYVLSSGFGLGKMKQAPSILSNDFVIGFFFYGAGFILWLVLLRRLPLSVAFPLAAGGLIVFVQFVGMVYLGESMSVMKLIGVSAIVIGIALIYHSARV